VLPERTLEGRSVLGIEIADDVHASDGRPVWYMDGLHHAREWPSGELTLMFAFELLENPEDDERIAGLRRDTRTILVPVVNPDGFSWSRDALVQVSDPNASLPLIVAGLEAYWRKNRRGLVDQAMVPHVQRNVTAYGVDPNRNYSARWGGPGASGEPVLQDHRGEYPFSEPEARNVAALLRERQPVALNSNHTYTGLVLRPWGHTGGDGRFTPDEAVLRDLGAAMCEHNGYENWHSIDLYATTGTTVDWGYAALGALSYTFEIGFSNFHPPYAGDDGVLHHYRLNREAFILLGRDRPVPARRAPGVGPRRRVRRDGQLRHPRPHRRRGGGRRRRAAAGRAHRRAGHPDPPGRRGGRGVVRGGLPGDQRRRGRPHRLAPAAVHDADGQGARRDRELAGDGRGRRGDRHARGVPSIAARP
jgi:hypothetical protein